MHVSDSAALRARISSQVKLRPLSWQRATDAAKIARNAWSIEPGPVSNEALSEIVGMPAQAIEKQDIIPNIPMTAGFRDNRGLDVVKMIINKRSANGRRFAVARLMGDHLVTDESERLLPASDAATHRQKFQRAFAQEFLCPYQDLMNFFGVGDFNEEAIEDAAAHFNVSPLLVRTTLVNKGHLDRTCLVVAPTV